MHPTTLLSAFSKRVILIGPLWNPDYILKGLTQSAQAQQHIKGPLFLPKMSRGESVQNFRPPLTNGGSTFVFTGQISIIKDPSRHHFWAIFFDENFPCTSLAPSNWPPTLLHCLLVCKSDFEKITISDISRVKLNCLILSQVLEPFSGEKFLVICSTR